MTAVVVVGFTACLLTILYLIEEVGNLKEQNKVWKTAYGKALQTVTDKCDTSIIEIRSDLMAVSERLHEVEEIPSVQLGVQAEKDKKEFKRMQDEDYIPAFFRNRK